MYTERGKVLTAPSLSIRSWLRRQVWAGTVSHATMGAFSGLFGCAAVVATFYAIYTVAFMIFARGRGLAGLLNFDLRRPSHELLLIVTAALIVLLFVTFFAKGRDDDHRLFAFRGRRLVQSISTILVDVLYIAPQLFKVAVELLTTSVKFALIDINVCSRVLSVLAEHSGRVSYHSIIDAVILERPVRAFRDVSLIDGVVVLTSEPCGLSLTADLRQELAAVIGRKVPGGSSIETQRCRNCEFLWTPVSTDVGEHIQCPNCAAGYRIRVDPKGHRFIEADEQPVSSTEDLLWSCRILGIPPNAGLEDARKAYRKLIKENHPDLVYGLGAELEQIAAEKSKEINKAYELFVERVGQPVT